MRRMLAFLMIVAASFGYAQRAPEYAKTGRIVTIEHWASREATVWAVQDDRIVVYKVFDDSSPDQLLAEIPIGETRVDAIKSSVLAIPAEKRGHVYMPRGAFDGTMLRISFTSDGQFANDRIEVQNVWLLWLGAVTGSISEALPDQLKITFKDMIEERDKNLGVPTDWPVDVVTIEEYYAEPGQAAQDTTKSDRGRP